VSCFGVPRILRFLWYEQGASALGCNTKITRTTEWRLHYCVSRVDGWFDQCRELGLTFSRVPWTGFIP
jgi:hypothetical protein